MGCAVPRSNRLLIRIANFIFAQISILSAPIAGKTSRVGQIYPWIEKLVFLKIGCPGWGYFQGSLWFWALDIPARFRLLLGFNLRPLLIVGAFRLSEAAQPLIDKGKRKQKVDPPGIEPSPPTCKEEGASMISAPTAPQGNRTPHQGLEDPEQSHLGGRCVVC